MSSIFSDCYHISSLLSHNDTHTPANTRTHLLLHSLSKDDTVILLDIEDTADWPWWEVRCERTEKMGLFPSTRDISRVRVSGRPVGGKAEAD